MREPDELGETEERGERWVPVAHTLQVPLATQAPQSPLTSQTLYAPLTVACEAREPLKPEV